MVADVESSSEFKCDNTWNCILRRFDTYLLLITEYAFHCGKMTVLLTMNQTLKMGKLRKNRYWYN